MKLKLSLLIAIGIALPTKLVLAGNSAFPQVTQLGRWSCHPPIVPAQGGPASYDCSVSFPSGFADVPSLLMFEDFVASGPGPAVTQSFLTPGATMHNLNPKGVSSGGFTFTKLSNLTLGGSNGTLRDVTYTGSWIAVGPGPLYANVVPKYIVLSVLYAPPGGPKGTNIVEYDQENTVGTSHSVKKSFSTEYSISFEGSGGFWGANSGGGLGFTYSHEDSDKQSFESEISTSSSLTIQGYEGGEGVNNDYDEIVILPNPPVGVQLGVNEILWSLGSNAPSPTKLSVAWLKDPATFQRDAPEVKAYIEKFGITENNYQDILKSDPLATGMIDPVSTRYRPTTQFMYTPPYPCDSAPVAEKVTLSTKNLSASEHEARDEYSVDVSHYDKVGGDAGVAELKGRLTEGGKWTWLTQSSQGKSQSNISEVKMAVGGPPCGSNKPPLIQAYLDDVYGTYAFREVEGQITLQGNLTPSKTGIASLPVPISILDSKGRQVKIYPNAKGDWVAIGDLAFPLTVEANGSRKILANAPADRKIDFSQN
jgi:hypothetical protein